MTKAELVFVPMPAMGHLVSALEVAKLLVDLNSDLSISVLVLKPPSDSALIAKVDSLIANTISDRIKFINLPRVESGKDPPGPGGFMAAVIQSQRPLMKEAVAKMIHDSSSVPGSPQLAGFVLDMFLTSLTDLANEFGVPSYVFYTSSAAFLGFQVHIQAIEQNFNITELKDSDSEHTVPSYANPVPTNVFPAVMFKPETSDMLKKLGRELKEVRGIMINTFSELESHAVHSFPSSGLPSVYTVGPILNINNASGVDQNSYSDIMEWLDEQPPSSVVFLCFGSMGSFGGDQVKEIAYALDHSGHPFLWSLRKPPVDRNIIISSPTDYENVADVLPEGFLDRTARIGKIIGWAPQVAILGHPSIGGFVSHCGWNSTLESIWFGVPIATWPLFAEQQLNAFAIVKELGIGVEIKMDYKKEWQGNDDNEIISAERIERAIGCLMEQDSDVRKRVKEISENSSKALMDGGSSHSSLCRFITDVMDNMPRRN